VRAKTEIERFDCQLHEPGSLIMNDRREFDQDLPPQNSGSRSHADLQGETTAEPFDATQTELTTSAHKQAQPSEYKLLPEELWPQLDVRVADIHGRWGRKILLKEQVNLCLEYQGWGTGERLYMNGHHIHTTDAFTWRLVFPYIDFNLPIDEFYVPARIDVKASYLKLFQISRFKLTVAGKVIYEE
jgi:hypothetical protein